MTLSCAVLKMLLIILREGICTTDINVSLMMIFIAGTERDIMEPVE